MDIELYVYDLSKGVARQVSASLLGVQIDAIFHTSIVFQDVEYVYDGGIQTVRPGETHLGQPMQKLLLGQTTLPMDVIMDYLESIKSIYTPQVSRRDSQPMRLSLTDKGVRPVETQLQQLLQ
jgi:hypothetical protein